jgi:TonB family protein
VLRASIPQITQPIALPPQQPIRPIPPPPAELVLKQQRAAVVGSFGEVARAAASNPAPSPLEVGSFEAGHSGTEKLAATHVAVGTAGFEDTQVSSIALPANSRAPVGTAFDSVRAATQQSTGAQVASTGFDAVQARPPGATRSHESTSSGASTPLEILDKPRPEYSTEARRMRIEGDVTVEALFEASGSVRILRVLHGLGHGLDENARNAASAIRFRPAAQNGRPTDTVAVVHIQFQLVY